MTEVPTPECDCEKLCCPRCQRQLAIGRAIEGGAEFKARMTLSTSEKPLAPDGYPWPDVPYEEHLG